MYIYGENNSVANVYFIRFRAHEHEYIVFYIRVTHALHARTCLGDSDALLSLVLARYRVLLSCAHLSHAPNACLYTYIYILL